MKIKFIILLFLPISMLAMNQSIDYNAQLIKAAKSGNTKLIKEAINNGANIEARDNKYGSNALHWAVYYGNTTAIKYLLKSHINKDGIGFQGNTALHMAVELRNLSTMEILLKAGADIESRNTASETPLLLALSKEEFTVIKLLIDKGANVNVKDKENNSALHFAIKNSKHRDWLLSEIDILLKAGADIESRNTDFETPLLLALSNSNLELAEFLISRGANVNVKDKDGESILHLAVRKTRYAKTFLSTIDILLKSGADIESRNTRLETPLLLAFIGHNLKVAELLISRGAKINVKDNKGNNALHLAVSRFSLDGYDKKLLTIDYLLKAGADIESRNNDLDTPLLLAYNDPQATELLISRGANINVKDNRNYNALGKALHFLEVYKNAKIVVNILLKNKININVPSAYTKRLFLCAASFGYLSIVKYLLKLPNKPALNEALLVAAPTQNNLAVVEFLLKAGADVNTKHKNKSLVKYLIEINRLSIVPLLLEYGASMTDDQDLKVIRNLLNLNLNVSPNNCLISLAIQDKYKLVKELLSNIHPNNALTCIDRVDNTGKTAFMWAAARGEANIVNTILSYNNWRKRDIHGPFSNNIYIVGGLSLAQKHNKLDIGRLIYKYLAPSRESYAKIFRTKFSSGICLILAKYVYGEDIFKDDLEDAQEPKSKRQKLN